MKKLIAAVLLMVSSSAFAETPCWVSVGGYTFDMYKVERMVVTNWDSPHLYINFTGSEISMPVPNEEYGHGLIKQLLNISNNCAARKV